MYLLGIIEEVIVEAESGMEKEESEQLYDAYEHDRHVFNEEDLLEKRPAEQDSCPTGDAALRSGVTTLPFLQALTDSLRRADLAKMAGNLTRIPAGIFKTLGSMGPSKTTVQYFITFLLFASQILAANSTPDSGQTPTAAPMSYLPTPGSLVRLERSAETVSNRKTTQQKRAIPRFLSDHNGLQCLMTKYNYVVEIKPNGKVKGTFTPGPYSLMKFTSISTGFVAIQGNATGRYLAMDNKGKLVGLQTYVESSCNFYEAAAENNYFVYYQERTFVKRKHTIKRIYYVGFDKHGHPRPGKVVQKNSKMAHFLKRSANEMSRQGVFQKKKKSPRGRRRRPTRPRSKGRRPSKKPRTRRPSGKWRKTKGRRRFGKRWKAGRKRLMKSRRRGSSARTTTSSPTT